MPNRNKTVRLQEKAKAGDVKAQYKLGWMYDSGNGVPQDSVEAVRWYSLAAEQGDERAQNNLGWMYYSGIGVPQDKGMAAYWYYKAAAQGHAEARKSLRRLADSCKK